MPKRSKNLEKAEKDAAGRIETLDLRVVRAAEPFGDHPVVKAVGKARELADQPPLIAASIAVGLAGLAAGNSRLMQTGVRMLVSHAVATGVKTVIKNNFDRPRPHKVKREGEHEIKRGDSSDGEDRSLPSGHSAGAFAVARAVGREYPAAAVAANSAAAMASAVQVPRKAHFPSDVVAGVLIGIASEALVAIAARGLARFSRND